MKAGRPATAFRSRLLSWRLPGLALLVLSLLSGCGASGALAPGLSADPAYAFHVPPGQTFDMAAGLPIPERELASRLRGVRLLFLGEHHTEASSHAFQRALIEALVAEGRQVGVALEMFPPSVNPVLEDWRQGRLEEAAFVERSGWYRHWGFPWGHYRELFLAFRQHRLPLRGVNGEEKTRAKVRQNQLAELPSAMQEELINLEAALPPHDRLLLDTLQATGHAGELSTDSKIFRRFSRVQRMWERLMGQRSARWAASRPPEAVTVVLIGSGHLAHGLGANLQAARISPLSRLSVWDAVVDKADLGADGRFRVPLGMSDWVRVYQRDNQAKDFPSLNGIKLKSEKDGLLVEQIGFLAAKALRVLNKGDRILSLNGTRHTSPASLRLAYEGLPFGKPAALRLLRKGKELTLAVIPRAKSRQGRR